MFQLDKIIYLRNTLKSKGFQIKQMEWDTYFNWHVVASRSLQDFKIVSLKNLLQKANKNERHQEVPKTKNIKADMTPTAPLYLPLPECSCFTNSLSELPFYWRDY